MLLNIVINYILLNIEDDPSLGREVIDEQCGIEDMCFKAIKFSLEIPTVPIRKFLLLFFIYLRLLFGEAPCNCVVLTHLETKDEWKDLKFLKDL